MSQHSVRAGERYAELYVLLEYILIMSSVFDFTAECFKRRAESIALNKQTNVDILLCLLRFWLTETDFEQNLNKIMYF